MRGSSKSLDWLQAQQLTQLQLRKVLRSLRKKKDLLSQQSPQNQCDMGQASAVAGYFAVLQTTTCAGSLCLAGFSAQACKDHAAWLGSLLRHARVMLHCCDCREALMWEL